MSIKQDLHLKILLAEDNKPSQLVSEAMLKKIGADVVIAENGHEVLSKLEEQNFDLILMDCQMPLMDGMLATEKIRESKNSRYQYIPIIALTADVQQETRNRCLEAGMNDFLSKPFTFQMLIEILEKNIARNIA
jgi:CheY-like chemotaxis protein